MSENHKEYLMPEEGDEHIRTWMGFPCSKSIWKHELYGAQKNISLIAKTISKYEPVNILVGNEKLASQFQELVDEIPFSGNYEITKIVQPINDVSLLFDENCRIYFHEL